ncbi:MAG: hypothetical protein M1839_006698 [Geoglossum umbratile]|nr:MAG: hypothetical protein M1839_006698 [Geoglossum umbratile]
MPELVTNCRVPSDSQEKRECKNPGEADYSTREVMLHAARKQRYSVFTKWQKRWIVFLTVFAGWFSALSSFIFFPAITALANALHTSIEKLNLTVTSYLIFAAVAPSVVGSWADMSGRRPVYIVTLTIYVAANIGLALQGSFAALFVLRMLQSAGISGNYGAWDYHKLYWD